jgi:hypothetical protein
MRNFAIHTLYPTVIWGLGTGESYKIMMSLGYGLDDLGSRVRFPAEAGNFYLHHCVQNGSGAHPPSYPMGAGGSFPGSKAAGA